MSAQVVQAILIAMIGFIGLIMAFRRLLPATTRRMQSTLARYLLKAGRASQWQVLGRWLQPAESVSGACGSSTGCGSCGGCGSTSSASDKAQPLVFHRKPRSQN